MRILSVGIVRASHYSCNNAARGRRAERGVDGVVEEEIRFVGAVAGAGVPGQAVLRRPAHAGHRRHIGDRPREARGEAARGDLLEVEAVRVGEYLCQSRTTSLPCPVGVGKFFFPVRRALCNLPPVNDPGRPAQVRVPRRFCLR